MKIAGVMLAVSTAMVLLISPIAEGAARVRSGAVAANSDGGYKGGHVAAARGQDGGA